MQEQLAGLLIQHAVAAHNQPRHAAALVMSISTWKVHQGMATAAAWPATAALVWCAAGSEARLPSMTTVTLLPLKAKLAELAAHVISCKDAK